MQNTGTIHQFSNCFKIFKVTFLFQKFCFFFFKLCSNPTQFHKFGLKIEQVDPSEKHLLFFLCRISPFLLSQLSGVTCPKKEKIPQCLHLLTPSWCPNYKQYILTCKNICIFDFSVLSKLILYLSFNYSAYETNVISYIMASVSKTNFN